MSEPGRSEPNVQQVVPFFRVRDVGASIHFYMDGLGFRMTNQWTHEGKLRWCWLQLDRGAETRPAFVGNRLWVTEATDLDGYRLYFESPRDLTEDTVYSESMA